MVKERTMFLTKRKHRLKLPLPYASMLPEPSMRNTKSSLARQTGSTRIVETFQYVCLNTATNVSVYCPADKKVHQSVSSFAGRSRICGENSSESITRHFVPPVRKPFFCSSCCVLERQKTKKSRNVWAAIFPYFRSLHTVVCNTTCNDENPSLKTTQAIQISAKKMTIMLQSRI